MNPAGKLYCADVLTLAVVRAALADEYLIAILHCIEHTHCLHGCAERAFVACHEDGEGGERNGGRYDFADCAEGLTVGYDELGREGEACQCFRQLAFLHGYGDALVIEYVAQYLLLRQDESALGGGAVNRRYEHYDVTGLD